MEKVKYYAVGLNVITTAPNLILVNGYFAARSFREFHAWFLKKNLDTNQFKNWPFVEGISQPIKK